ncbi:hypothetical protein EW093_16640 [Thiospirochaeta perfilievii]|uniref:Uncharacterized protein n=1 Tax=Thiospirochaeta perfilievii TaxID=252967 RepID=A0A5C1QFQ6_9SPIO|nr:hypothetical protein [Thiospirochaeta perfilievii]QEN06247.1 hypothetical protein EW093_16640 [Thiospirochaeta perfilievii]
MKKYAFCIILILNLLNLYGNEYSKLHSKYSEGPKDGYSWKERHENYDINNSKLTIDKLCSTKWVFDSDPTGYNRLFIFYIDNVFKIGWVPSGVDVEGKYLITENELHLYDIKSNKQEWNNEEFILTFKTDLKESFEHGLIGEKINLYPLGSEPQQGSIFDYNGTELIKMTGKYYNIENVNIYENLTNTTEPIETMKYAFNNGVDVSIKMFIQGDIIEVIGKTKNDEHGGSWYLGKLEVYNSSKLVWFYTKKLIKYDESKNDLCNDLLEEGFILAGWDGITDDPKYMP